MSPIYLDNNATTRPTDEVIAAMAEAAGETWANPSSVHRPGQAARRQVDLARQAVCGLIGCRERELIFTSGGTESAAMAILGSMHIDPARRVLLTNRLEHSAVRALAEFHEARDMEVVWIPVERSGILDIKALERLLDERGDETGLVSVMWANNETGVIQPIEAIGALCRDRGVRFHCDGTQWVGKMPTNVAELPVDLLTFAGHKFHGPKGVGGLYVRRGVRLVPQLVGHQERDLRGGTENVPGIVGLGVAADQARQWLETDEAERLGRLRDRFEQAVCAQVEETSINGAESPRLWNTTNIAFARLESEAILLLLSERGVCASAGAACSSGSLDPSPVLLAMGIEPERAHGSVRFSLSRETSDAEIDEALRIIPETIARLRSSMTTV